MGNRVIVAAEYNAEFAMTVMLRAAELVGAAREFSKEENPIIDVLLKAWDQMQQRETARQRKLRTYGWRHLASDLRSYVTLNEDVSPDSLVPISEWGQALVPVAMASKLREAAPVISKMAEERTIAAGRIGVMSRKELDEHFLMKGTEEFLKGQGLEVEMSREWEDPNAPLDYRGTVDGVPWAFELTQLREDPKKGYHRKIGHPKERKTLDEQLRVFEAQRLPKVPNGPEALQRNLNQAIQHGKTEGKTKTLRGAKYCLLIHNQQFTNPEDWEKITWPDLGDFEVVMILHDQMIPPARVWQVIPPDGYGSPVETGKMEDVERLAFGRQENDANPVPSILEDEADLSDNEWDETAASIDSKVAERISKPI